MNQTPTPTPTPPILIEPGVRYFLAGTLKECRKFKDRHINKLFNIGMVGVLLLIFGGFLFYRYKGKLTPTEVALRNQKKHEYIISQIHQLAYIRKQQQPKGTITQLPEW
jgi:hypothetical protein